MAAPATVPQPRAEGEGRSVPIPPELVAILRHHEKENGLSPDGRIFFGLHGKVLSTSTYMRLWGLAREDALTSEEQAFLISIRIPPCMPRFIPLPFPYHLGISRSGRRRRA